MIPRPLPLAGLLLLASACTSSAVYPSLAPRPVEKLLATAPAETPLAATTDPALDATATAKLAEAEAGARTFRTMLAAARAAVGRPGATTIGSEAWIAAQQALTTLGAARAPVGSALGDLDAARIAAAARDRPVDMTRLDAAFAHVGALAAEQNAAYEDLAARLPNG